jgi:hypothetical protein
MSCDSSEVVYSIGTAMLAAAFSRVRMMTLLTRTKIRKSTLCRREGEIALVEALRLPLVVLQQFVGDGHLASYCGKAQLAFRSLRPTLLLSVTPLSPVSVGDDVRG